MTSIQTLTDLYQLKAGANKQIDTASIPDFNVFQMEKNKKHSALPIHFDKRDFYTIVLERGKSVYTYAQKEQSLIGSSLVFLQPHVPYTLQSVLSHNGGFGCIFREDFFSAKIREHLYALPVFRNTTMPFCSLNQQQDQQASKIFRHMIAEMNSRYTYKNDLLRMYLIELIHFVLKTAR